MNDINLLREKFKRLEEKYSGIKTEITIDYFKEILTVTLNYGKRTRDFEFAKHPSNTDAFIFATVSRNAKEFYKLNPDICSIARYKYPESKFLVKPTFKFDKEYVAPKAAEVIPYRFIPNKVIYNGPATIVYWMDGTKTVVKICEQDDKYGKYDRWSGFALCLSKKVYGDRFHKVFNEHCSNPDWDEDDEKRKDILELFEKIMKF